MAEKYKWFPCLSVFLLVLFVSDTVYGQTNNSLTNRINRLEAEMGDLHLHLFSKNKSSLPAAYKQDSSKQAIISKQVKPNNFSEPNSAVQTIVKLQQIESLVRSLQGVSEELNNRIDKLVSDLDRRLAVLEVDNQTGSKKISPLQKIENKKISGSPDSGELVAAQQAGVLGYLSDRDIKVGNKQVMRIKSGLNNAGSPKTNSDLREKKSLLPKGDISTRYKHAFQYLTKREFKNAEIALLEFLNSHPNDALAGNAMYWLGESYYTRGLFGKAVETFASGYEKYSKSSKTPDNLLKLGFSLVRLERSEDACVAFAQLLNEFPGIASLTKRRATLESKRIGCKS
jgi:tol-pal system protein YbgF